MSGLGLFFVGAGLLFARHPSAAVQYPDSVSDGRHLVRYAAAPGLVLLEILIFLDITIQ